MRTCSLCLHSKTKTSEKKSYAFVLSCGQKTQADILRQINSNNSIVPGFTQYCMKCQTITYLCEMHENLSDTLVRHAVEKRDKHDLWKSKDIFIQNNQANFV